MIKGFRKKSQATTSENHKKCYENKMSMLEKFCNESDFMLSASALLDIIGIQSYEEVCMWMRHLKRTLLIGPESLSLYIMDLLPKTALHLKRDLTVIGLKSCVFQTVNNFVEKAKKFQKRKERNAAVWQT